MYAIFCPDVLESLEDSNQTPLYYAETEEDAEKCKKSWDSVCGSKHIIFRLNKVNVAELD